MGMQWSIDLEGDDYDQNKMCEIFIELIKVLNNNP